MAETAKMNPLMEKIFFRYLLDHPEHIDKVVPAYFKDQDIRYIYTVVREHFLTTKNKCGPRKPTDWGYGEVAR